jgi:hypothetical protein
VKEDRVGVNASGPYEGLFGTAIGYETTTCSVWC